ncbi:MAG: hypothetical protein ACFE0Q_13920 [Anaerolineae bacterium]
MIDQLLAGYLGKPEADISALRQKSVQELKNDSVYQKMIDDLDMELLNTTMARTREYMDNHLPPLVEHYKQKYSLETFPITGYMVCNWVMAYIKAPHTLHNLQTTHNNVPQSIIIEVLPEVLEILGNAEAGKTWQKAFSTIVIPLTIEKVNA